MVMDEERGKINYVNVSEKSIPGTGAIKCKGKQGFWSIWMK